MSKHQVRKLTNGRLTKEDEALETFDFYAQALAYLQGRDDKNQLYIMVVDN